MIISSVERVYIKLSKFIEYNEKFHKIKFIKMLIVNIFQKGEIFPTKLNRFLKNHRDHP